MRSKEVERAIKNFENCDKLISIHRPKDITIENPQDFNKDVETVLNYISELETRCKMQEYRIVEMDIPKQMIRDKIKELEEEEQELQNSISEEEREEYSDANISFLLCDIETKRKVLKELLGE